MERLVLKTYDDVKDRSHLICSGGAVLLGVATCYEFFSTAEPGLRFWLMLLTMAVFAVAAKLLVRRHQISIEVIDDSESEAQLKIIRRGKLEQVISKPHFGYVKLEKKRVIIHHYEGEDLRRTSFSIRGASRKKVTAIIEVLESWQA